MVQSVMKGITVHMAEEGFYISYIFPEEEGGFTVQACSKAL